MKNIIIVLFACFALFLSSCVQKSYDRHVKFLLDVSHVEDVKTVGIRGSNSPLSWNKNTDMTPIVKDSLYTVLTTFNTGYLGAEVKFVVNDQFELQGQENRRFPFDEKNDTTIYQAKFDTIK